MYYARQSVHETFEEIYDLLNAADRWKEPHVSKAGLVTPICQSWDTANRLL